MANQGSFIVFTMSMFFLFSTMYTIVYYYDKESEIALDTPLGDVESTENKSPTEGSIISSITSGFIDDLLGFLAVINPFGLVIWLIKLIAPEDIYTFINLILLRPLGWTGTMITSNFVISKIRGTGEIS